MSSGVSGENVKAGEGCVICLDSVITGDVTIGRGTVIHPKARILAEAGPIIIGERNLIEDGAVIVNRAQNLETSSTPIMIIGNFNVFEVHSHCEALKVGDNNVLESKSFVGREVTLSNNCFIGARCSINCPGTIPENTVIYSDDCLRRTSHGHQQQNLQLDQLKILLPKFHETKKIL